MSVLVCLRSAEYSATGTVLYCRYLGAGEPHYELGERHSTEQTILVEQN